MASFYPTTFTDAARDTTACGFCGETFPSVDTFDGACLYCLGHAVVEHALDKIRNATDDVDVDIGTCQSCGSYGPYPSRCTCGGERL
jgi:hypothetical protein